MTTNPKPVDNLFATVSGDRRSTAIVLAREASHVVHPVAGLCMGDMICEHHGTRSQRSVELPDLAVVFRIGPQGNKTGVT